MSSDESIASDNGGENDLERIIENDGQEGVETVENEGGSDKEDEKQKRVVKPKRAVKNPRPKLNAELLMGPKGLSRLEKSFKNVKFRGPGHEADDLHSIMTIYEYWCHRLCPKFTFDESLEKLEKLGNKKNVQTYIKRIRLGMEDFGMSRAEISDEEDENRTSDSAPRLNRIDTDEERLTEEQLERMRINKERAQRLRLERLQKMQSKDDSTVSESNTLESSTQQSTEESLIIQNTEDNSQTPSEQSELPVLEHTTMETE